MIHPKYRQLSLQTLLAMMSFVAIFAAHVAWRKERDRKSLAMVERFNTTMAAQRYDEAEVIAREFAAYSAGRNETCAANLLWQVEFAQRLERGEYTYDSSNCYNLDVRLEDFMPVCADFDFQAYESLRIKREKLASPPANVSNAKQ
jgi:hypothetical protein